MIKKICAALGIILLSLSLSVGLCGCDRYSPIPPTEEESRVVAKVGDYDVLYDEFRFVTVQAKKSLALMYDIDWNDSASAEAWQPELSQAVYESLTRNYTILSLFDELYAQYDDINASVAEDVKRLIDFCGGKQGYIEYLEENFLTDRIVRQNLKVNACEFDLLTYYSEVESDIDTGYDAVFEYLLSDERDSELIRVMHICIGGKSEESFDRALALRQEIVRGADIFELAKEHSADYESMGESGDYISRGDYFDEYEEVAFHMLPGEVSEPVLIGADFYVICRLEKEQSYIMQNYEYLYQKYLYLELDKIIGELYRDLKLEKTPFGESLDLVSIK